MLTWTISNVVSWSISEMNTLRDVHLKSMKTWQYICQSFLLTFVCANDSSGFLTLWYSSYAVPWANMSHSQWTAVVSLCILPPSFPPLLYHYPSYSISCVPCCCHDHRCQGEVTLTRERKLEPQILLPYYLINQHTKVQWAVVSRRSETNNW